MTEGAAQRLVRAVLLFHGCEGLRSARIAVELFHFILGRFCLRATNNPPLTTNFLERLPRAFLPLSRSLDSVIPSRPADGDRRFRPGRKEPLSVREATYA